MVLRTLLDLYLGSAHREDVIFKERSEVAFCYMKSHGRHETIYLNGLLEQG